jgi:radical SAM-linked protein
MIRRAGIRTHYTEGFHPKPDMSFGPALALGIASTAECIDVKLIDPPEPEELIARLNEVAAVGVRFLEAAYLGDSDPGLAKIIDEANYVVAISAFALAAEEKDQGVSSPEEALSGLIRKFHAKVEVTVERDVKGIKRRIDVKNGTRDLRLGTDVDRAALSRAGIVGDLHCFTVAVPLDSSGAVRAREIVEAIGGKELPFVALRTALLAKGTSPFLLSAHKKVPKVAPVVTLELQP